MVQVNLKQLEVFRAVMIAGSTSEAATLLNLSQPAVSRSLQNLEAQVDYPLFLRQHGRLHPTPEAEYLYHEIDRFQSSVDHLANVMGSLRLAGGGHLRIIASTPLAQSFLPTVLAAFQARWPEVRVSIRIVVRRERARWMESQQFDVALFSLPVDYPEARMHLLAEVQGVCILPAGHRLCDRRDIDAADLADENFISIIPDTILRGRVDAAFSRLGIERRNAMIETQTGASICQLVAQGLGVSVVDPFTASAFEGPRLAVRRFRPAVPFSFGLLLPVRVPESRFARDFLTVARDTASGFAERLTYL